MKTFCTSHTRWGRAYSYQRPWRTREKAAIQCFLTNAKYFCAHTTPNTWLPSSPNFYTPDYYMWGAVEQETNKTPRSTNQRWIESRDNGSIYKFKQEDFWRGLQKIPKSSGDCGWNQWWFLWIKSMYIILKYFHAILI